MDETKQNKQKKTFFERMGVILNAPLPGTEASPKPKSGAEIKEGDDYSLLARIKDILNTPLPGSETLENQLVDLEAKPIEITEDDVAENWWESDWAAFKAYQDQDRKGLNMKQRQDQEGFAQYQEQERFQFEAYQAKEFELFQSQQQAKINWIQNQQLAQAAGVEVAGMVPPAAPVAPLAPQMPTPPWV
jgi:hypothetical protein